MRCVLAGSILAALVLFEAAAQTPTPSTPAGTVQSFYAAHLSRRELMSLSRASLAREQIWLTPRLRRALEHELDWYEREAALHGGKANFKPFVSGDVFTGFEEAVTEVRGADETLTPAGAEVRVTCHLRSDGTGQEAVRPLTVILVQVENRWLIDNLIYNAGDDLLDLLNRPIYDSYGT